MKRIKKITIDTTDRDSLDVGLVCPWWMRPLMKFVKIDYWGWRNIGEGRRTSEAGEDMIFFN